MCNAVFLFLYLVIIGYWFIGDGDAAGFKECNLALQYYGLWILR
jgi:hypothetical protein